MIDMRKLLPLRISGICSMVSGLLLTLIGAVDVIEGMVGGSKAGTLHWLTLITGVLIAGAGLIVTVIVQHVRNMESDRQRQGRSVAA